MDKDLLEELRKKVRCAYISGFTLCKKCAN